MAVAVSAPTTRGIRVATRAGERGADRVQHGGSIESQHGRALVFLLGLLSCCSSFIGHLMQMLRESP
jgi:hypothetical protein